MTDHVKLYNPANASSLTPEQVAGLQKLTSSEIKELAVAYPNMSLQRAYLLIIDNSKPVGKQLPALSSFENLWNLREKNGLRNFVAYSFKGSYKPNNSVPVKTKKVEVLDLSETELMSLPGFKKDIRLFPKGEHIEEVIERDHNDETKPAKTETVKVTKVIKVAKKTKK